MLKPLQKTKNQSGFTIIEVLIVLAIAGLILLIVFLAVPALQRNSRDTSRKNDASRLLGAVQEVVNNNGGAVNTTVLTGGTGGTVVKAAGDLGYYAEANVSVVSPGPAAATAATDSDKVAIYLGSKCVAGGKVQKTSASRQVAILYFIESAGGTSQCVSS